MVSYYLGNWSPREVEGHHASSAEIAKVTLNPVLLSTLLAAFSVENHVHAASSVWSWMHAYSLYF